MTQDNSKSGPHRGVVGVHQGRVDDPLEHMRNFGKALNKALEEAKMTFFPDKDVTEATAEPFGVTVTFEAVCRAWNPGVIDEYRAILTENP
jgi:hypothetical protein